MTTAREDYLRHVAVATGDRPFNVPGSLLAEALAMLDVEREEVAHWQRLHESLARRVDEVRDAIGSQTLVDGGLIRKLLV